MSLNFSNMKPVGWYSDAGHRFYTNDWVDEKTGLTGYHCAECEKFAIEKELE